MTVGAAKHLGQHGVGVAQVERHVAAVIDADDHTIAIAELVEELGAVGKLGNDLPCVHGTACRAVRAAVVDLVFDLDLTAFTQIPVRIEEGDAPVQLFRHGENQREAVAVARRGRAMREASGAVVGVGANVPVGDLVGLDRGGAGRRGGKNRGGGGRNGDYTHHGWKIPCGDGPGRHFPDDAGKADAMQQSAGTQFRGPTPKPGGGPRDGQRARVKASHTPPPMRKPPEIFDNSRTRARDKAEPARPALTA